VRVTDITAVPEATALAGGRGSRRVWWSRLPPAGWTGVLLVAFIAFWQTSAVAGWVPAAIVPRFDEVVLAGIEEIEAGLFVENLASTVIATVAAHLVGSMVGLVVGVLFWRKESLGRMFEPYLVSFYAVPLVVFYPVALVVLGINDWPIIILSTVMAAIPMALNAWNGFAGIPPVYLRLADSLTASSRQTFFQVAIPAAAPLLYTGTMLAAIYALIGVVAMEFMVARNGLGSRIRYLYEAFDNPGMYFYIVSTLAVSILLVGLLNVLFRRAFPRVLAS